MYVGHCWTWITEFEAKPYGPNQSFPQLVPEIWKLPASLYLCYCVTKMLLDYHVFLAVWTFAANRSVSYHHDCAIIMIASSMRLVKSRACLPWSAVTPRAFVLQILRGTKQLPAWTWPGKPSIAMLKSASRSANAVQAQCVSEFLRHFVTMKQSTLQTFAFCTCKTLSYSTFRTFQNIRTFRMV